MGIDIARDIKKIIDSQGTKVSLFFGRASMGDDYDPYSKNRTYTNMNPKTIKAWVSSISAEKLVWRQYGLSELGAKSLICESKYKTWFQTCNRIVIDNVDYSVYKIGNDARVLIEDRPGKLIRVTLEKKV